MGSESVRSENLVSVMMNVLTFLEGAGVMRPNIDLVGANITI